MLILWARTSAALPGLAACMAAAILTLAASLTSADFNVACRGLFITFKDEMGQGSGVMKVCHVITAVLNHAALPVCCLYFLDSFPWLSTRDRA